MLVKDLIKKNVIKFNNNLYFIKDIQIINSNSVNTKYILTLIDLKCFEVIKLDFAENGNLEICNLDILEASLIEIGESEIIFYSDHLDRKFSGKKLIFENELPYLKLDKMYQISYIEDKIYQINIPKLETFKVEKLKKISGADGSYPFKYAIINSYYFIIVPSTVNKGDEIIVDTVENKFIDLVN